MGSNHEDRSAPAKAGSAASSGPVFDRMPVPHVTARHIQEMIRTGALAPGQRLPGQRELAERLGVSRASLREALLTLETLGLIQTRPGRGTFVVARGTQTTPAPWRYAGSYALHDVFQCRLLLECEICRLVAAEVRDEDLRRMREAAEEFRGAWGSGDLLAHVEADLRFHEAIAAACPNRMLRELYGSVRLLLAETQRQPLPATPEERMQASIQEHHRIVDALGRRDPRLAAAEMRNHIVATSRGVGVDLEDTRPLEVSGR